MIKTLSTLISIFLFSCTISKKSVENKYYPEGYSLNFRFNSTSHEYLLQSSDQGVAAIIPQFDSILFRNESLFMYGSVIYPRTHKLGKVLKVDSVTILYAQEINKSGRLILIDSLGISNPGGKFSLKIQYPKKTFYLLFMKDSLIPCAQIINSKK